MSANIYSSRSAQLSGYIPGVNAAATFTISSDTPDRILLLPVADGNKSGALPIMLNTLCCLSSPAPDQIYLYALGMGAYTLTFRKPEWAEEAFRRLQDFVRQSGYTPVATLDEYISCLTPDEQTAFYAQQQAIDADMNAKATQVAAARKKSSLRGAIIGYVVTAILCAYGLSAYAAGNYMIWFGIEMEEPWQFMILIGLFLILDTWALIRSRRGK